MASPGDFDPSLHPVAEPTISDVVIGFQPSVLEAIDLEGSEQQSTNALFLRLILGTLPRFKLALESFQISRLTELVKIVFDLISSNGGRFVRAQVLAPGAYPTVIWYEVSRQDAENFIWQEAQRVWNWARTFSAVGASQAGSTDHQVATVLVNPHQNIQTNTFVEQINGTNVSSLLQSILQQQQEAAASQQQREVVASQQQREAAASRQREAAVSQQLSRALLHVLGRVSATASLAQTGSVTIPTDPSPANVRPREQPQGPKQVVSNAKKKWKAKKKRKDTTKLTTTLPVRQVSANNLGATESCSFSNWSSTGKGKNIEGPDAARSDVYKSQTDQNQTQGSETTGRRQPAELADALLLLSRVASGIDAQNLKDLSSS